MLVAGGTPTAAVAATGAMALGTDGTDVYFGGFNATLNSGYLSLAPVGNLAAISPLIPTADVSDIVYPLYVDTAANSIFNYVLSTGIWQEPLQTPNSNVLNNGFGNDVPTRIVADATNVYWAGTGFGNFGIYYQVISAGVNGVTIALASSSNMNVVGLSVQGPNVYYVDATSGSVARVATSGGELPTQLATASAPIDLVADLSNVYWIDSSGAAIMKVPTTGGTATQFAAGGNANAIAADATSIYWTNSSGVMRAPK